MNTVNLTQGDLTATFLPSGDLFELSMNDIMLNQLNGNQLDGSLNQIYLRIHTTDGITSTPLIGTNSSSYFHKLENCLVWSGHFEGIVYQVSFSLGHQGSWFWKVDLEGAGENVDLIYGQDVGNASKNTVHANEAYVSQYNNHSVFEDEQGYKVVSRQNQPQDGLYPTIQMGGLGEIVAYSTDGYQFFTKDYVRSGIPKALSMKKLPNEVYQYEFAYIALQSKMINLTESQQFIFYGYFVENHTEAVLSPLIAASKISETYSSTPLSLMKVIVKDEVNKKSNALGEILSGETLDETEIDALFPNRLMEEVQNNQLLSFYTKNDHHVVLQEKELLMERSHGHILLSGTDLSVDNPLMSTTVYMHGLFNSQIVLGNTSMNKLMSNSRNALNAMKRSGQRIYLKLADKWHLLGLPSIFEMGLNSATWYYKLQNDLIIIETYTITNGREIRTSLRSQSGQVYDVLVTNHLLMSGDEIPSYTIDNQDGILKITATDKSAIHQEYPDLTYYFKMNQEYTLTDESILGIDTVTPELLGILFRSVKEMDILIQGSLTGMAFEEHVTNKFDEDSCYYTFVNDLLRNFHLSHPNQEVDSINILARWYTHNMLVHYLSPHGLEQYGGAAWGTRDVSQGPTEFFLALDRPEIVADIIEKVYANQFLDDGNWPQWFMFDRYEHQKANESHGDVIVWPMKIVADYLGKTDDLSILDKRIAYTERKSYKKTKEKYTLFEHLKKEIDYIESNFLEGTYLSCYGDGDWDDTLQPNDPYLKKQMASSWTVALTYQVIGKLAEVLKTTDPTYAVHLSALTASIKKDYETYILSGEVLPGFILKEDDQIEFIIHPTDKKTGISYRLLPMTRSMIAELLTPEQAESHLAVIKENLQFPDGVRLMNRPANYQGGVSTYFKRAEQAANFGREIGLQYVHAHIRFAEAMAKLGKKDEALRALEIVNPILIQTRVANATLRQSNVYFSSSDGDFKTRYEAQENFDRLKEGTVEVKGGWRIYSSGPGIYLNQLITNILGIRSDADHYLFDPVLPVKLDGLRMTYQLGDKPVTIHFYLGRNERKVLVNGEILSSHLGANPYRDGALAIDKSLLENKLMDMDENKIEIFC
ncbi:GH36-type glycosyl hydrolase domain-containing protein [Enterococcus songbeiensis]|uniref:GH36-type glycosyl hydrolase domain-containing protein n=1 Tax=Enterococcus songbeiensis TaxID=2559927 RepID=UPI0010F7A69A|nr:cellobiose phosphorylase [Enterococcus songbeiensis]